MVEETSVELESGDCFGSSEEEVSHGEGEGPSTGPMKRKKVVPGEGRRRRRKAVGDGIVNAGDGVAERGPIPVSVRGRCTLELICDFKKKMEGYHREAVERTIFKPVLEYRGFSMQRELTTALVMAWVPQKKGFRLAGRVVSFSVFDVALFTGFPATSKQVQFGDESEQTLLGRLVRERMGKYVEEKRQKLKREKGSKKP